MPAPAAYVMRIGGFVDPMPVWRANGNGLAKIIVTLTATETAPLQVGRALQKVEFKGYRKIKDTGISLHT